MVVDCHTHLGERGRHIGGEVQTNLLAAWGESTRYHCTLEEHWQACAGVDRAIVLAFAAPRIGWVVPNDYVSEYVCQHPEKLIGFASVDPNSRHAPYELERAAVRLGLKGLKLAPIYQHFDPLSSEAYAVYEAAQALRLPVLWHQGTTFVRDAPLIHARPVLLDQVATDFPELRMWVAHMGHPWIDETIAVARKHPHFYMDVSALHPRPFQFYRALVSAVEYGVANRLFFGSDYPFFTAEETMAGLRRVNHLVEGTNLPRVDQDIIEGIIRRNPVAAFQMA